METAVDAPRIRAASRIAEIVENWSENTTVTVPLRTSILVQLLQTATSAEGVANVLRKFNIKGEQLKSQHCPIANAISDVFDDVEVTLAGIYFIHRDTRLNCVINVTPAMAEFIRNFDNGVYPDLDSER